MSRFHGVEHLAFSAAMFLDAIGVSIEHFEDGERLHLLGKFLRHMKGRRQRHHGMEADIIFAAKSAGIGQRRRRD